MTAARPVPRTSAGSSRWRRLPPGRRRTGRSRTPGTARSRRTGRGSPSARARSCGTDRPSRASAVGGPLGRAPAAYGRDHARRRRRSPRRSGSPGRTAPASPAGRVASIDATGMPVRIDRPRSPLRRVAARTARTAPAAAGPARSAAGSRPAPPGRRSSPASARAGSPGSARTPMKTTIVASTNVTADCQRAGRADTGSRGLLARSRRRPRRSTPSRVDLDADDLLATPVRLRCRYR